MLAWQRTALSLGVASAVGIRLTIADLGVVSVVAGALGIALAVTAYLSASVRYRRTHRGLVDEERLVTSGRTMVAVAGAGTLLAVTALTWVVVR